MRHPDGFPLGLLSVPDQDRWTPELDAILGSLGQRRGMMTPAEYASEIVMPTVREYMATLHNRR